MLIASQDWSLMGVVPNTVLVATLHPGMVTADYSECLATLMLTRGGSDGPIKGLHTVHTARSYIGRNDSIQTLLGSPLEWLLWIDSDMQFMPETFDVLWAEAHTLRASPDGEGMVYPKIVNALAFMYSVTTGAMAPNIMTFDKETGGYDPEERYEVGGRFWCDATGVAFTLIHREVFEAVGYPWHVDHISHPDTGMPMGHDIGFFHMARKHGYHVRYCADAHTGHVKPMAVNERLYDLFLQSQGRDGLL